MQLVIAEKPSVAQSIAVALGVKEKKGVMHYTVTTGIFPSQAT